MLLKIKYHLVLLTIIVAIHFLACNKVNKNDKSQKLTIDTFSDYPDEIDGCSCVFSNDSSEFNKGQYIYMNDFGEFSFLKINGVLTKFSQTEYNEINQTKTIVKAKSDQYEIIIDFKKEIINENDLPKLIGTIKLIDKNKVSITKKFYGECGC